MTTIADNHLAELSEGISGAYPGHQGRYFARRDGGNGLELTKLRYSHDAMIDLLVANPWISQNQLAIHFGYTSAWVSTVMATDMFQAKLAQRREEIVDPALKASLEERFRGVVMRSLQVLQEKLSAPTNQIPDSLALKAAELGAKALGIGGNAPPAPPLIPVDHLTGLAERLIQLQSQTRGRTYDANLSPTQLAEDVTPKDNLTSQVNREGRNAETVCPHSGAANQAPEAKGDGLLSSSD